MSDIKVRSWLDGVQVVGEMDFGDPQPVVVNVRYKGKDYILKEADEAVACKYRNACAKAAKFNDRGKFAGAEGIADTDSLLVSMCLFEVNPDGREGELGPVSQGFIKSMPAKIVKQLFKKAQEIGDLKEKADTVEDVENEIAELQARKKEIETGDTAPKESRNGTTSTSD